MADTEKPFLFSEKKKRGEELEPEKEAYRGVSAALCCLATAEHELTDLLDTTIREYITLLLSAQEAVLIGCCANNKSLQSRFGLEFV